MISINKCRKILGETANNLSDQEIREIRDHLYSLAYLFFDLWAKKEGIDLKKLERINKKNISDIL